MVCDNEFEKMPKVIPPKELGVTFDDSHVSDNAKETLHELVMLPFQWPELLLKGPLTKVFSDQGRHYSDFELSFLKEGKYHYIQVAFALVTLCTFARCDLLHRQTLVN